MLIKTIIGVLFIISITTIFSIAKVSSKCSRLEEEKELEKLLESKI